MMMNKLIIPPIKCQGIKSKLVPTIHHIVNSITYDRWIEPFFGSGVVGFNIRPRYAIFADSNPHLINFYTSLQDKSITPAIAKSFLVNEGKLLEKTNGEHYYVIRERFNKNGNPLDFLFLNRSCFNGMIRFNSKGGFNVPFCRKPNRFAQAYVTKIVNQIAGVQDIILYNKYTFICQSFEQTLENIGSGDLVYCDPPYIGRHVDYFDSWDENDEIKLHDLLTFSKANFIFSTWHSNEFRNNDYINTLWKDLNIHTKEHFYHVGGSEDNRNPMLEALLTNFSFEKEEIVTHKELHPSLF